MRYVCDTCFEQFPSGSIDDIPGTVIPTVATVCSVCKSLVTPGIELTGHMVDDRLPTLNFIPVTLPLSSFVLPPTGSLLVSGSR